MNTERINVSRFNKIVAAILLFAGLLYWGRSFLIPAAIASFFAMLLYPVTEKLERWRWSRSIAALGSVLILISFLSMLGVLVYFQLQQVKEDLPQLETRFQQKVTLIQQTFSQKTDISEQEQDQIIEEKKPDIYATVSGYLKDFVFQGAYLFLVFFIILAYTFFFLIFRKKIKTFLIRLNLFNNAEEAQTILNQISDIAHHYLRGTFTVISILAVIYFLGFWAIGLQHALLFAIITALLRIVPYFGSFLGVAFPIAFAFLTKDEMLYPLLVLGFFMVTQILEAYLLTPYITGSRVKLNPLVTILAILLGKLLWGIPGMVVFVPLTAILKVILDSIPALAPFGYMLGKEEE